MLFSNWASAVLLRRLGTRVGLLVLAGCLLYECQSRPDAASSPPPAGVVPVYLRQTSRGYHLERGGKPFFVKGGAGLQRYEQLKAAGANSVRLWSTDYADDRLNEAQRQGLTVMLGLWLVHESRQFDYYDKNQVERQHELLRRQVLRYRNHPALLAWNVGNEVNYESANPQLYRALNEVARMVHELDPYHPVTTTVTSTLENLDRVRRLCPDIDFISVNSFGNLAGLQSRLLAKGWTGPHIVTEFGARGYWESPKTSWHAAKEQTSTEKATFTRQRYQQAIVGNSTTCLGSYVFFWGSKFEYTHSWFSLFAPDGEKTATVDVMRELWSGTKPQNQAPGITRVYMAGSAPETDLQLTPGGSYTVHVEATDPENDSLRFVWQVAPDLVLVDNPEKSDLSARLATPPVPLSNSLQSAGAQASLRAPLQRGPYRIAVSVFDGKGSVATATLPFYVGLPPTASR